MRHVKRTPLVTALLLASCLLTVSAMAQDAPRVDRLWARPTPTGGHTGAAYLTINGGRVADRLIAVSTPVAASADVHQTVNDAGVMKMRPVKALTVAPEQQLAFAPGGYHVMLMGLKHQLAAGSSFPLTLIFEKAGPITVTVSVQATPPAAGTDDHMGHSGMSGMGNMTH